MEPNSLKWLSLTQKAKKWLSALLISGTFILGAESQATPCARNPPISSVVESWTSNQTFYLTILGAMMRIGDTRYASNLESYAGEKRVVILLNSTGGFEFFEKLMVDQIEQWKKEGVEVVVRIPSGAEASSAALSILTAGSRRSAAPSALFGFHGASVLGDDLFFHISPVETKKWTDQLVQLGAKDSWIDQRYQSGVFNTRELTCLKPKDLIAGGMLDEIVEDRDFR